MEFDGRTYWHCRWDGRMCRCVQMRVTMQAGGVTLGRWGVRCSLNAPLPPTTPTTTPCSRVGMGWVAATAAKRPPHQACGPMCWVPWRPHARSLQQNLALRKTGVDLESLLLVEFPRLSLLFHHAGFLSGYWHQRCHFCCSRWKVKNWSAKGPKGCLLTRLHMSHLRHRPPPAGPVASHPPRPAHAIKCGSPLWPRRADHPAERPCGVEPTAAMHRV